MSVCMYVCMHAWMDECMENYLHGHIHIVDAKLLAVGSYIKPPMQAPPNRPCVLELHDLHVVRASACKGFFAGFVGVVGSDYIGFFDGDCTVYTVQLLRTACVF